MSILKRLYDSEINFRVSVFWDGGFDLTLGDDMNGIKAEAMVDTWAEAERWFEKQAEIHFPGSLPTPALPRIEPAGEAAGIPQDIADAAREAMSAYFRDERTPVSMKMVAGFHNEPLHHAIARALLAERQKNEAEIERLLDKAIIGEYMWTPAELDRFIAEECRRATEAAAEIADQFYYISATRDVAQLMQESAANDRAFDIATAIRNSLKSAASGNETDSAL